MAPAPVNFFERLRSELALPSHVSTASLAADAISLHCGAVEILERRHPASFRAHAAAARSYAAAHTAVRSADWLALAATVKTPVFSAESRATLAAFAKMSGINMCCASGAGAVEQRAVALRYLATYVQNWEELVPALYRADGLGPLPSEVMRRGIVKYRAANPVADARVVADVVRACA